MLPLLADYLEKIWGPFRLFNSRLFLMSLGPLFSGILTWWLLPKLWHLMPRDQGKPFVKEGEEAKGKPTGAGLLVILITTCVLALVLPCTWKAWGVTGCLLASMLTGYLDDASEVHWKELKKGLLDLVVCLAAAAIFSQGHAVEIWLPLLKGPLPGGAYLMPFWLFLPLATFLLWLCINVVNCSDGIDNLAGSLSLVGLFIMGAFLYGVIGHQWIAKYLLLPHDQHGAIWSILIFTCCGGLAGYLWHNAHPSAVMMGDAGSRPLGLLIGLTILASHNPFMVFICAPFLLLDGGLGLVKLTIIRFLKKLGYDTRPPLRNFANPIHPENFATDEEAAKQFWPIRLLHQVRCPLHDHCRRILHWSDTQVLVRFNLIQAALMPILLLIMVKVR